MALLKFNDFIFELGTATLPPFEWIVTASDSKEFNFTFQSSSPDKPDLYYTYDVTFYLMDSRLVGRRVPDDYWFLSFVANGQDSIVTNQQQQFRVLATVLDITKNFIKKENPSEILFVGDGKKLHDKYGTVEDHYGQTPTIRTKFYREYIAHNMPSDYKAFYDGNQTALVKVGKKPWFNRIPE